MVDTIRCINERDLTPDFYIKLLTGAIDSPAYNQTQKAGKARVIPRRGQTPPPRPRAAQTWTAASRSSQHEATSSQGRMPLGAQFQAMYTLDDAPTHSPSDTPNADPIAQRRNPITNQLSSRGQTLPNADSAPAGASEERRKQGRFSFGFHRSQRSP